MLVLEQERQQQQQQQQRPQQAQSRRVPLCVDLDGTLIQGDLLFESLFVLLRQNALYIFLLPLWLWKGKAYLKEQIALRVQLDPTTLPYREDVLDFIHNERNSGRYLVLATASHRRLAKRVAEHLELFDEVIASNCNENLKGLAKLEVLQERFDRSGFDYIGDSKADLPIWKEARHAYLVQPSRRLLKKCLPVVKPQQVFHQQQSKLKAAIKLLRPHQWVKNLLLFVPLVLAHQFLHVGALVSVILAFVAFSLCASSVYVLNDLLDIQADRKHPKKKHRPLAAGTISMTHGLLLFVMLLAYGLLLPAATLPPAFVGVLLVYMATTTAYSFYLKRQPIVDVFALAGLYTLRILAGGLAAGIPVTGWLLAFSLFFFISLALVKRYSELARAESEEKDGLDHRGYRIEDLGMIQSIGPASGYMAVLTMCLYINTPAVLTLYPSPQYLWVISFVLFYWITRVWFLARRRQLNEDPVVFATCDPVSYISGIVIMCVLLYASI